MKTTSPEEYLDSIALKRRIQKEISAETKGMTLPERLAHYKKLAAESPFAPLLRQRGKAPRNRAKT